MSRPCLAAAQSCLRRWAVKAHVVFCFAQQRWKALCQVQRCPLRQNPLHLQVGASWTLVLALASCPQLESHPFEQMHHLDAWPCHQRLHFHLPQVCWDYLHHLRDGVDVQTTVMRGCDKMAVCGLN